MSNPTTIAPLMERGKAYWTYDPEAGAWYLGLNERASPPYLIHRHVDAILDMDDQGRLAGVEILEAIQPPARDSPREMTAPLKNDGNYIL